MIRRNHGLLTVGPDIQQCFAAMYGLERSCQAQVAAMACNTELNLMPDDVSRQDLLRAVRSAAIAKLAVAMEGELAKLRLGREAAGFARASLSAVGTAYLHFAQAEPRLLRTAFSATDEALPLGDPARAGASGRTRSNCSAPRSTGLSRRGCCRPSAVRARNTSPSPRCTGSPCSSSKAHSMRFPPRRRRRSRSA
jgi:hypothetical protein